MALAGWLAPTLLEAVSAQFAAWMRADILGSVVPTLATVFALLLGGRGAGRLAVSGVVAVLLGLLAVPSAPRQRFAQDRPRAAPAAPRARRGGLPPAALRPADPPIAGNPVAPLVVFAAVFVLVGSILVYYANNNNGTEFFVESEPENAIVYVRARGNLSIDQKDALVREAEEVVLDHPNVRNAFAFAGDGGLNNNTGGAQPPLDTIGQVQLRDHPLGGQARPITETWFTMPVSRHPRRRARSTTPNPTATGPSPN